MSDTVEAENRFKNFWGTINDECRANGLEELSFTSAKVLHYVIFAGMREAAARRAEGRDITLLVPHIKGPT